MKPTLLNDTQVTRYVENNGLSCPFCNSNELFCGDFEFINSNNAVYRNIRCHDCHCHWDEVYTLSAIADVYYECYNCDMFIKENEEMIFNHGHYEHANLDQCRHD